MELISAVLENNIERVYLLLSTPPNTDVNFQDNLGKTALIYACDSSKFVIVEMLLSHPDIDINLQDNSGRTALMYAVNFGFLGIVKMLVQHPDIDVNIQSNTGNTALTISCDLNFPEITKTLLQHPDINVNLQTNRGTTALMFACKNGLDGYFTVEMLLNMPATDVNLTRENGEAAISIACRKSDAIVELILQYRLFIIPQDMLNELLINYNNLIHNRMYDPNLARGIGEYFPNMLNLDLIPLSSIVCVGDFIEQYLENMY